MHFTRMLILTAGCSAGDGFILVYSVASRSTFERAAFFLGTIGRLKGKEFTLWLVGNQCDRDSEREVSVAEGDAFAQYAGCSFVETSAKTKVNIQSSFEGITEKLRPSKSAHPAMEIVTQSLVMPSAEENSGSFLSRTLCEGVCIVL